MSVRNVAIDPGEYGRRLAASAPPLTPEQIEGAVRILVTVTGETDDSAKSNTETTRVMDQHRAAS